MVADGTAAESFTDWHRLYGTNLLTPFLAAEFAGVRVTSGGHPGPPHGGHDQARPLTAAADLRGHARGA